MSFPLEILDRIFGYLPPVYYPDLIKFSNVDKAWYLAARRAFYKNLNITSNTRVARLLDCLQLYNAGSLVVNINITNRFSASSPPISSELNSFRLLTLCPNAKRIEIQGVNPFHILRSNKYASFLNLQEIRVYWSFSNSSSVVKKRFYLANYVYRASISYITLPPANDINEVIDINLDRTFTRQEYLALFPNLTSRLAFSV